MKRVRPIFLLLAGLLLIPAHGAPVLPNGDFEQADPSNPSKPANWDLVDGLAVQWTNAPAVSGAPPHGKAIRMDTTLSEKQVDASYLKAGLTQWLIPRPTDTPISISYGTSLYSEAIPIIPGKTYRVTFDYMSTKGGPGGKLWFRGYGNVDGQMKRVYEGTVDCDAAPTWKKYTGIFHPTRYRPNVSEFKIMLFALYPGGIAWFDNIDVEAVDDSPPSL